MAATPTKKLININPNILLEYEYNSNYVSENYQVWSDISRGTRNFLSTTNYNDINHNLFVVDPVLKKYAKIDTTKFNFLRIQNYFSSPVMYDKVTMYFPNNYNFDTYVGFYFSCYSYDYYNKTKFWLSNFYYDKTGIQVINGINEYSEYIINLGQPFLYNGKEWGKYIQFYVPSINSISNQRDINTNINQVTPDSINDHLTNGIGLSLSNPLFLEFSFVTSKTNTFGTDYFNLGDTAKLSIPRQPEFQSLGVSINESTDWDFFEIYGTYNNSNENLDNFVNELENKGKKINIEYVVTLYEENLISGFPTTFLITENFSQKIEYRPIIKYSNTTAVIDVEMKVIDLIDNSSISRLSSIGLTNNLLKYGKKLARLDVSTITKPKIYNYKADKIMNFGNTNIQNQIQNNQNIVKIPFPILINNYKILASNYTNNQNDYKSMGTLNIVLTPFDNVIKFQIGKQDSIDSPILPYSLSEIIMNGKLNLVFQSDNKYIEKDIYYQTDENRFDLGIVVFKVNQEDVPVLKQMSKDKFDNFYIILNSNKTKTLLYSGKFKIFDSMKFVDISKNNNLFPITSTGSTTTYNTGPLIIGTPTSNTGTPVNGINTGTPVNGTSNAIGNTNIINTGINTGGETGNNTNSGSGTNLENTPPPQFDASGIPVINPNSRGQLDYYRNLVIYAKPNLSDSQLNTLLKEISIIGIISYYKNNVFVCQRVKIEDIELLKRNIRIDAIFQMKLDFGWSSSNNLYNTNIIQSTTGTTVS